MPIEASMLEFEFHSEDGEVTYACRHSLSHPVLQDWKVVCGDPARAGTERTYFVHLRLASHVRPTEPKQAYQLMYFVRDPKASPSAPGRSQGTYAWLNLKDLSALRSFELSQELENVNMLTVRVRVP